MSRYTNYEMANNVFGTLSAPISSLATSIQLATGQGQRFTADMLATLESMEGNKVTKREIVKITNVTGDTLTVIRKFAPCPSSDDANTQGQVSYSFSTDDTISVYISKEHFDKIDNSINDLYNNWNDRLYIHKTWWLWIEITAWNAFVWWNYIQYWWWTATLTDNSTNYVMITDGGSLYISLNWRENDKARIAIITTSWWTITNIDNWKIDNIWWKIWWWDDDKIFSTLCLDSITEDKVVSTIWYRAQGVENTIWFWNSTNAKVAFMWLWNWIAWNTISVWLWYNWNTNNDITLRIETDNAWQPSWTLVDNNATLTISKTNLTQSWWIYTWTFWQAITITKWTKVRVVLSQSTSDNTNYWLVWYSGEYTWHNLMLINNWSWTKVWWLVNIVLNSFNTSAFSASDFNFVFNQDHIFNWITAPNTKTYNVTWSDWSSFSFATNTLTYNIQVKAGVTYNIHFNATSSSRREWTVQSFDSSLFASVSWQLRHEYSWTYNIVFCLDWELQDKQDTKPFLSCWFLTDTFAIIANSWNFNWLSNNLWFASNSWNIWDEINIQTSWIKTFSTNIGVWKKYYLWTNGDLTTIAWTNKIIIWKSINETQLLIWKQIIYYLWDWAVYDCQLKWQAIGEANNVTVSWYLDNNDWTTAFISNNYHISMPITDWDIFKITWWTIRYFQSI